MFRFIFCALSPLFLKWKTERSSSFYAVLSLCKLHEVPVFISPLETSAAHVVKNNPSITLSYEDYSNKRLEDFTAVVLLHELAHIVWNRENEYAGVPLCNKTVIEIYNLEYTAWLRAEKLAIDHAVSLPSFAQVKSDSLKTYANGVYAYVQKQALTNILPKINHEKVVELSQELEGIFHEYDL